MEKKFKIGDKVRITTEAAYHGYQVGDIVTIKDEWEGKSCLCVNDRGKEQFVNIEELEKVLEDSKTKETIEISNDYKPNDKVVVIDSYCIGYSLNEILTVSKVLYNDVLEVTDKYGDIGLIKTEYVEPHVEKEQFKVGDFVKVVSSDRRYFLVGVTGLVSYVYSDGDVELAIVDIDGDFHSDALFKNNEVQKIEIGEL